MQRPKLPLRDLFWLVALAALALGWYREHVSLRRALHETKYDLLEARQRQAQAEIMASNSLAMQSFSRPIAPTSTTTPIKRPPLTEAELNAALEQAQWWDRVVTP
jgi:hypothetical protein